MISHFTGQTRDGRTVSWNRGEWSGDPTLIRRADALRGADDSLRAIAAAGTEDREPISALQQEIASLASEPAGAGLDLPDWLAALEDEVTMVRCRRRQTTTDEAPRRIKQVRLTWDEWQRQIADDANEATS